MSEKSFITEDKTVEPIQITRCPDIQISTGDSGVNNVGSKFSAIPIIAMAPDAMKIDLLSVLS